MARPSSFHSGGHDQYTGEEGMDEDFDEKQAGLAAEFDRLVSIGVDPAEARKQVTARDRSMAENYEIGMRSPANEADYLQDTARPTEADKHPLEDAA